MEDKRRNNGGHKTNGGRHTKADELKVNELFNKALKVLYKQDTEESNKVAFVIDLLDSQRGQIFVAEHLFGKAKDTVETTLNVNDFNIKDYFKVGTSK
jgi:septation ring formation regulator EzrA